MGRSRFLFSKVMKSSAARLLLGVHGNCAAATLDGGERGAGATATLPRRRRMRQAVETSLTTTCLAGGFWPRIDGLLTGDCAVPRTSGLPSTARFSPDPTQTSSNSTRCACGGMEPRLA